MTGGEVFAPLRDRSFRLLFAGRTISFLGNAVAPVGLAFAVVYLHGSPLAWGLVLASGLAPQLLFLLVGGVIGDRLRRQRVMVVSDVCAGLAQSAAAALLLTGSARIWHLVALSAIGGTASAFFFPASQGIVPQIVGERHLQSANALLGFTRNGTWIFGTAAAGGLVAAFGAGWVIAIDAASYFAGAVLVGRLALPGPMGAPVRHFRRELAEGWSEVRSRRWLWPVIVQFGFINAVAIGSVLVLGPFIAERSLGGATSWGVIMSAQGCGLLVGGLATMRIRPSRPLLVGSSAVFFLALPPLMLALALPVALVAVGAFAAGAALEIHEVLWFSTLQHEIPQDTLARVMSFEMLGSMMLAPVAGLVIGPLAGLVGDASMLWAGAVTVVATTAAVLGVSELRRLRRRAPEDELPVRADALAA